MSRAYESCPGGFTAAPTRRSPCGTSCLPVSMSTPPKPTGPSFSDNEEAAQKRFNIMAAAGLLIVLVLAFFVLTGGSDDAEAATTAPAPAAAEAAPDSAAAAEPAVVDAAPPPGVSGGGGGGAGFSGSSGRPTSGTGTTTARRAPDRSAAATVFTRARGALLGLSPRAASALADSAAGHRGASAAAADAPTSGPATVGRATTLMSEPGSGTVLVTVPSGTRLSISGCTPSASGTWCRASHAGFSGWVLQSDIGR